ncbi:MAG: hypothetical protein KC486_07745, partial [Myxococcales bacterium]|nr:hypothetical protein [Myxococcales bacterium]
MQRAWTRGAALAALFGGALSGCLDLGSSFEATEGPPEVPLPTCEEVGCAAVKHIETAGIGTCALLENGEIRCWGSLEGLPLGDGQTGYLGDDEVPGDQGSVDVGGPAQQLSTNCALLLDGAVRCWGSGRVGLGYGDRDDVGDDEPPAAKPPIAVGFPVVEIDAHSTRMCARSAAGEVRCWGLDDDGALGRGISASLDCVHDGGEYEETYYDCERHPDCCVGDDEPPSASP